MAVSLEGDDAFPEVNHSGNATPPAPGGVAVCVDRDEARVMAERFKHYGQNPVFSVE